MKAGSGVGRWGLFRVPAGHDTVACERDDAMSRHWGEILKTPHKDSTWPSYSQSDRIPPPALFLETQSKTRRGD